MAAALRNVDLLTHGRRRAHRRRRALPARRRRLARRPRRRRVRGAEGPRRSRRRGRRLRRPRRVGARARQGRVHRPRLAGRAGRSRRDARRSRSSGPRSTRAPRRRRASTTWARTCSRPTLIAFGTPEQQERFLPGSCAATSAGARATASPTRAPTSPTCRPRAVLDGDEWVINGQKVWTSLAHWRTGASCRAHRSRRRHATRACRSCSCRWSQPGIEIRPDRADHRRRRVQRGVLRRRAAPRPTSSSARSATGWQVAMGTARLRARACRRSRSRSASSASSTTSFDARDERGTRRRPGLRQRLVDAWIGLRLMRWNAMRTHGGQGRARARGVDLASCSGAPGTATSAT